MLRNSLIAGFTISAFILGGCSSQKTEQEQYEEATSGLTYKTYKLASGAMVNTSVEFYNKQQPDSAHLQAEYAHLLLGYFWSVSGKPSMAFAEADITEEDKDNEVKFLAQSLRSVTMYQQGWHTLAKAESVKAQENLSQQPNTDVRYEAAIFYLIMGSLHVQEKDFTQAKFFWAGFATETGIHWPYQLCDAAADLQAGNVQQGLQKIKVMSQDPAVPQVLREELAKKIEEIEKHAGTSVDSSLFWPKLIAGLLWEELQKSTDGSMQELTRLVNNAKEALPV